MRWKVDPEARPRLTWSWVGVVMMSVVAVAALRLSDRATGVVVAAALVTCLLMVGAMVWMDWRDTRRTAKAERRG